VVNTQKGWRCLAAIGMACLLAGCGGVSVQMPVNRESDQTQPARIAVVEFTHPIYQDDVADSVTFGKATSSNSGNIVADLLCTELQASGIPNLTVIPRDKTRDLLKSKGLDPISEAKRDPKGLAQALGADRLVVGNVESFESGFIMMVSWTTVAYTARCIEPETGKEAWSLKGKLTRYYDYEEHVAALIAHDAVAQLKARLQPPPQPGAPRATPKPAKGGWPFWETVPPKNPQPQK